ncbi:MAG: transglutaminase-like cysteine peptidase [Vibrio sp.]
MKYWIVLWLAIGVSSFAAELNPQEQQWINAVQATYGPRAGLRVKTWRHAIAQWATLSEQEQLPAVNAFFNQLNFINDIELWGVKDYWATPLEFLGSNAGDCEDFTIAKYFSLLELDVSDKKLRLVYVKAIELNQFHMVLAYYANPSSEPVILDNINPQLKPASTRQDLLPIYSFNGKSLWLMKSHRGQWAGDASRLSLWNDLRARERSLKLNKPLVSYDE